MTPNLRIAIRGTGMFVPERRLTNADFEKMIDTSDEWITTRTGIKERRIVSEGESTMTMALEASRRAMNDAKIQPEELDLIICGTVTPHFLLPATACFLQAELGRNPR